MTDPDTQPAAEPEVYSNSVGRYRIHKVVGFYDVAVVELLPFHGFTLKVVEKSSNLFVALPNVVVFNSATQCLEHTCGLGETVGAAIRGAIDMFMGEVRKQKCNKPHSDLDETDFVWLGWQPYVQLTMPPIH